MTAKYTVYSAKVDMDIFERQSKKRGIKTLDYLYQVLSEKAAELNEKEEQAKRIQASLAYSPAPRSM